MTGWVWIGDGRTGLQGTAHAAVVAPDGLVVTASRTGAALSLYPLDGGSPRPVPGGRPDDRPPRWSADGKWLFVRRGRAMPAIIERLEVATGRRLPWKQLMPTDRAGLLGIAGVAITPDGASSAYTFVLGDRPR